MRDMPPLNALRAFVSTARLLSATKAAAELHVTLGAVSHQLRALEEFLGVELSSADINAELDRAWRAARRFPG
jgi:LysR family glycine cleavage system transcriptional activator